MTKARKYSYIVIFGAVWGASEMFLGGLLHAMHVPLRGMIMAGIAAFLLISNNLLINEKNTSLTMGGIAAFLKLFSLGGLVISPAIAILIESLIAEICFLLFKRKLAASLIAGILIVSYTITHRLFSLLVIYRTEFTETIKIFVNDQSALHSIGLKSAIILSMIYIFIHIVFGMMIGFVAFTTLQRAMKRIEFSDRRC